MLLPVDDVATAAVASPVAVPACEIIGDLATYLVPRLCPLSDCQNRQVDVSWRLPEQVDVTALLVLAYMHAYGFKTPTREFSQFDRNLN
jgi:hypothetical protein